MAVTLRPARSDDHDGLEALLAEADELHARILPAYFRPPRRTMRARDELVRLLGARDQKILVADEGGRTLGLVHVQIYDTPAVATMVPKRRAHVDNLIVAEAARRRGLGRRLLDAAAEWARGEGAREILLTVWAGNESAERFYEALGFTRVSSVLGRAL